MPRQRQHALQIFRAALRAADPYQAVLNCVSFNGQVLKIGAKRYRVADFDKIWVLGAGKASAAMASAIEGLLARSVSGGLINVPDGIESHLRRVELQPCGHPIPDERGEAGARRMLEIARAAGPRDLLIALISGGASALLPAPAPPLTLEGKQQLTRQLLACGATIHEMNTVRKHLSLIKGGQLAQAAYPAKLHTLMISDVVGDDPEVIGSGPTVPDPSTVADAKRILKKYGIVASAELKQALHETPKPGDPLFRDARYRIIASNKQAIAAAAKCAQELGYHTRVLSTTVQGETRDAAFEHAEIARRIIETGLLIQTNRPIRLPACLLSGGETTVTVRGNGMGGRNQEFVLAAILALYQAGSGAAGPVTVLSAGTDGIDGPTDAAGAIADSSTLARAAALGLDARGLLDNNDSYHFFEPLNALLKTGPTGTNVADVRILLIPA
jgi:glycerate 2-kinase